MSSEQRRLHFDMLATNRERRQRKRARRQRFKRFVIAVMAGCVFVVVVDTERLPSRPLKVGKTDLDDTGRTGRLRVIVSYPAPVLQRKKTSLSLTLQATVPCAPAGDARRPTLDLR